MFILVFPPSSSAFYRLLSHWPFSLSFSLFHFLHFLPSACRAAQLMAIFLSFTHSLLSLIYPSIRPLYSFSSVYQATFLLSFLTSFFTQSFSISSLFVSVSFAPFFLLLLRERMLDVRRPLTSELESPLSLFSEAIPETNTCSALPSSLNGSLPISIKIPISTRKCSAHTLKSKSCRNCEEVSIT